MKRKNPLFANIQYSIGYVYRWIVRATKCQGFGIQSPWAFRFARNVINEHAPYYAYSELKKAFPYATKLEHKLGKLYFRVANFMQPTCWCIVGEAEEWIVPYVKAGCKTTRVIVAKTEKDYLILDKAIFQSGLWERLDLGTLSREELVDKILSLLGDCYQKKVEEVIWNWPAYIDIYTEVFPLLARLKENGHRIFVLSNTSPVFYELLKDQLAPLEKILDGFVLSCDIKAIKPDPKMFEEILRKYQLDPANCVFLDDIADNTKIAESLGIKAYQVKQRSDVVDILKKFE